MRRRALGSKFSPPQPLARIAEGERCPSTTNMAPTMMVQVAVATTRAAAALVAEAVEVAACPAGAAEALDRAAVPVEVAATPAKDRSPLAAVVQSVEDRAVLVQAQTTALPAPAVAVAAIDMLLEVVQWAQAAAPADLAANRTIVGAAVAAEHQAAPASTVTLQVAAVPVEAAAWAALLAVARPAVVLRPGAAE